MLPELNKIYTGDCLEIMRSWPDKCVDLVVTDPPYNLNGADITDFRDGKVRAQDFNSRIGTCNEEATAIQFKRLLSDKGTIIIWMADRQLSLWWKALENVNLKPRYTLVWTKTNPMPQLNRCRPTQAHEMAIVATHLDNWGTWMGRATDQTTFHYGQSQGYERPDHPCPKPINLIQRIIQLYANESTKVLDCFLGSGTTALACERAKRSWVGIEINPDYVKIAEERIARERAQLKLFDPA